MHASRGGKLSIKPRATAACRPLNKGPLKEANSTSSTLSIADSFFFEELSATLGYAHAAHWLAQYVNAPAGRRSGARSADRSSCSSPFSSPRRQQTASLSSESEQTCQTSDTRSDMSELAHELGADGCLLYTDAAHVVLDVPLRSPRKAVDIAARRPR
jgi:hypothetical protein